jgi:hypothetical protein
MDGSAAFGRKSQAERILDDFSSMTTNTASKFRLAPPQLAGPLAVYPIFGGESRLRYYSLTQGVQQGAFISEIDEHGDVNEVLVCNASKLPVLLYEGELILGARQNRTIDAPVLVPKGVELHVPVSCVEQGRWEDGKRAARFVPAAYTVDPELRREKRARANQRGLAGSEARPDQGEVWGAVSARLTAHGVASASGALSDVYEAERARLDELKDQIHSLEDQVGVVAEIGGRPVALDLTSRAEAFADLLPRLVDGYALLAMNVLTPGARIDPSDSAALDFFEKTISSRRRWLPTPGMGDAFALTRRSIHGCGLRAEGELVALSAFPAQVT